MKVSQERITPLDQHARDEHEKAMDGCRGMFVSLLFMTVLWSMILGVWLLIWN